jgi:integrase
VPLAFFSGTRAAATNIMRLLGHRGLETTEIYTHVEIDDLKRVVEHASSELSSGSADLDHRG